MSGTVSGALGERALEPRRASITPAVRLTIAGVLTATLLGGVVWGALETAGRDVAGQASSGSLSGEMSQRRSVQLAVSAFAANLTTYSVDDVGGYKARLTPLMTPGFAKSFGLAVDGIVAEVKATKMRSQGQVAQTAVTAIDSDSATALVVADVQVRSALGDRVRHFRWKVTLVRHGGGWLVDGFEPVA
jgi:Mce-associated membrane protein